MRRRDVSFVVVVACATLAGIYLVDAILGLDVTPRMALYADELTRVLAHGPEGPRGWWSLATIWMSCLAHADLQHLASNLVFLWLFGTLLAQLAGERWVLYALLLTPIAAAAPFVLRHADTGGAVLGASGAISGISGLYVVLAFRWDADHVHAWPLSRPVPPAQAAVAALIAAALDVLVLRAGAGDGVARDAHIGGFAGGMILGALLTTFYPTLEQYQRARQGRRRGGNT